MAPSPTAEATLFIAPDRTSPAAKIPGTEVSRRNGSRLRFHCGLNSGWFSKSRPVSTKPLVSFKTFSGSQWLLGMAPIKMNNAPASRVIEMFFWLSSTSILCRNSLPLAPTTSLNGSTKIFGIEDHICPRRLIV